MLGVISLVLILGLIWQGITWTTEPLKIGFSAGLTGTASELGVSGRNGLMMAVGSINEAGGIHGREVQLVVRDDENHVGKALEVDKAHYQQGIQFIIGHMTSNMAEKTLPFINQNNLLMITPTMSSHDLTGKDDHLIRVVSSNKEEAVFMAEIYKKNPEIQRVTILYDESNAAYTQVIRDFFTESFQGDLGKEVVSLAFHSSEIMDYGEWIGKVVETEPDGLMILSSAFDAAMFCQQLEQAQVDLPVLLSAWSMTRDLITHGGTAVEGVHMVSLMNRDSQDKAYLEFAAEYQDRYEEEPSFSAIFAHDAATVLFESLLALEAEHHTPQEVKDKIISIGTFRGLQSDIEIDQYGDARRELYEYTIIHGEFVKVEKP